MFKLNNFTYTNNLIDYNTISDYLMQIVKNATANFIFDKNMFSLENFKFYYFDDFLFNTNTSKNNYLRLYLEINQPLNIKAIPDRHFRRKVRNNKINDLHLTLEEIKDGIFNELVCLFDENTTLWQDKYSIKLSINYIDENSDQNNCNYLLEIIPCFYYENENKEKGIIYYNNNLNEIEIEYPQLSINNMIKKNNNTNNLFYKYLIAFKNMFMLDKKVENLIFEVFEVIFYNVPDSLYLDETIKTPMNIINYLRNKNVKEFKTLDELDLAYTSKYKSFSLIYAKYVIKTLEKIINKLKN